MAIVGRRAQRPARRATRGSPAIRTRTVRLLRALSPANWTREPCCHPPIGCRDGSAGCLHGRGPNAVHGGPSSLPAPDSNRGVCQHGRCRPAVEVSRGGGRDRTGVLKGYEPCGIPLPHTAALRRGIEPRSPGFGDQVAPCARNCRPCLLVKGAGVPGSLVLVARVGVPVFEVPVLGTRGLFCPTIAAPRYVRLGVDPDRIPRARGWTDVSIGTSLGRTVAACKRPRQSRVTPGSKNAVCAALDYAGCGNVAW